MFDTQLNNKYFIYNDIIINYKKQQVITDNTITKLKQIYGCFGDLTNFSISFSLTFVGLGYNNITSSVIDIISSALNKIDNTNTSVISIFLPDKLQYNINVFINISWSNTNNKIANYNAYNYSTIFLSNLDKFINNILTNLQPLFIHISNFNVLLNPLIKPICLSRNVPPVIISIDSSNYNKSTNMCTIIVYTVGLYNNMGIIINNQSDDCYFQYKPINNIFNIPINPILNTIIVSLFDINYKKINTFIQAPLNYINANIGAHGNAISYIILGNIIFSGSISSFSQGSFIGLLNTATNGFSNILSITSGSTIINYNVTFDSSTDPNIINNTSIQLNNISTTQNIFNSIGTVLQTTSNVQETITPSILSVNYDGNDLKNIIFITTGSFQYIAYKIHEDNTFLTTTQTKITPPSSNFIVYLDAKLVDINDNDLTSLVTYNLDSTPPVINIIGNSIIYLRINIDTYIEYGSTANDISGTITPSISYVFSDNIEESISNTVLGTYIVTYTATNLSNISSTITRTVIIKNPPTIILFNYSFTQTTTVYIEIGTPYIDPGYYVDNNISVTINENININQIGSYIVTYTATDEFGLTTTISRNVIIKNPPIITLNGNSTIYTTIGIPYTDTLKASSNNIPIISNINVNINQIGSYSVIYTATDEFGITSTATRIVIVEYPPTIILNGNDTIYIAINTIYSDLEATAKDYLDNVIPITSNINVDTSQLGSNIVTYTATDLNGLTSTSIRTVIVINPPIIILNGNNTIYMALNTYYNDLGAIAKDYLNNIIPVILNISINTSQLGSNIVTYTATDEFGITSTTTRTVIIINSPTIILNGNNNIIYTAINTLYSDLGATARDYLNNIIPVITNINVNTSQLGTNIVTYTATDLNGLTSTSTRTVIVINPPTIILNGSNTIYTAINTIYSDLGAMAKDYLDNIIPITSNINVDTSQLGSNIVTYTATDSFNISSTIIRTVIIETPPVIYLSNYLITNTILTYMMIGSTYIDPGYSTNVNATITSDSNVNIDQSGINIVTYTAINSYGLITTAVREVIVINPPFIVLTNYLSTGSTIAYTIFNTSYVDPGYYSTDYQNDTVNVLTDANISVNTTQIGTYIIHYTATDNYGITSTNTRTVNVINLPKITLSNYLSSSIVYISVNDTSYTDPGYSAVDNYNIPIDITIDTSEIIFGEIGSYTITYTATDSYGFTSTDSRQVIIQNIPYITLYNNINTISINQGDSYIDLGATATDFMNNTIFITGTPSTLNTNIIGVYTINYNYTDIYGLIAQQVTKTVNIITSAFRSLGSDAISCIGGGGYNCYTENWYDDPDSNVKQFFYIDLTNNITTFNSDSNDNTFNWPINKIPINNIITSKFINFMSLPNYKLTIAFQCYSGYDPAFSPGNTPILFEINDSTLSNIFYMACKPSNPPVSPSIININNNIFNITNLNMTYGINYYIMLTYDNTTKNLIISYKIYDNNYSFTTIPNSISDLPEPTVINFSNIDIPPFTISDITIGGGLVRFKPGSTTIRQFSGNNFWAGAITNITISSYIMNWQDVWSTTVTYPTLI